MVHGPYGPLNLRLPCIKDCKCNEKYPISFLKDTHTGNDGYPSYRRSKPEDGGAEAVLRMSGRRVLKIDNRWVVPYSPYLCKTVDAHINVEFCNCVKSIKYIYKFV